MASDTLTSSALLTPAPTSPNRTRSISQPLRPGFNTNPSPGSPGLHARTISRSLSSNSIKHGHGHSSSLTGLQAGPPLASTNTAGKGRARSGSLVTVTEVGGDDLENDVDRLAVGVNENAAWVNAPGAWLIHPVMILLAKVLVDAIPHMTQDLSWTITNLGYMAVSFVMFHHVTGVPFESSLPTGGAYDDLTLWEQIDAGAQYTPAKKWLTSVPICLFLISTHYTKYDFFLFGVNFAACLFVLFPKLPILHRLRFHFLPQEPGTSTTTPGHSRPPSPRLSSIVENVREK